MHKLAKRRKILAGTILVASLLIVSLVVGVSEGLLVRAGTDGGSGTTTGGNGGTGSLVTSGDFISNNTAGYRIYFARKSLTVGNNKAYFTGGMYTELGKFRGIALHEFYAWSPITSGTNYLDKTIYNYYKGSYREPAITLGKSKDNDCSFSEVGLSGSIDRVDYQSESFNYSSFATFSNDNFKNLRVSDFKKRYIDYLDSISSSLSTSQLEEVSILDETKPEDLTIVVEPVFVSGNSNGNAYTIGWQDWVNGLRALDTEHQLSNRCDKLVNMLTEFTIDGTLYTPSKDSNVYGFGAYQVGVNSPSEQYPTSFGVAYNITHIEDGTQDILPTSVFDAKPGADFISCVTSQYSHLSKDALVSNLGGVEYTNAFKDVGSMYGLEYTPASLANTDLIMAGDTYNSSVVASTAKSGADYSTSALLVASLKHTDMGDKLTTPSNYMLGVYGGYSYPQVTSLENNEKYVRSVDSYKLPIASGSEVSLEDFYRVKSGSEYNNLQKLVTSPRLTYKSRVITDTGAKTIGSIFDSSNRLGVSLFGINLDVGYRSEHDVYSFRTRMDATIPLLEETVTSGFQAEYENGEAKYQGTGEEVKDLIAKIDGATLGASKVNLLQSPASPSMTILDNSSVQVTVTNLVTKRYKNNYVASARLGEGDDVATTGRLGYKFMGTGQSFVNKHLLATSTDFNVNSKNFSTVGETGLDGRTYAIYWKTADLVAKAKTNAETRNYDLTYDDRDARAENLTSKLAEYLNIGGDRDTLNIDNYVGNGYFKRLATGVSKITGIPALSVGVFELGTGADIDVAMRVGASLDSGYSVLILTVDEFDIPVIGKDALPSNMINMVVPSLLGTSSSKGSSGGANDLSALVPFIPQVKEYSIIEDNGGDAISFFGNEGLFYNQTAGKFFEADVKNKDFKDSTTSVPSYAYTVARTLFGDNVTPSSFRGVTAPGTDNAALRTYITDTLKFKIGSVPSSTVLDSAEGEEAINVGVRNDTYWFSATSAGKQLRQMFLFAGSVNSTGVKKYNTNMEYKLTHNLNKYTAPTLATATTATGGTTSGVVASENSITYKCAVTDESSSVLKLYPEVNMLMHYPSKGTESTLLLAGTQFKASVVENLYVMGEKVRSFKPTSVRLLTTEEDGVSAPFKGDLTSDTMAVSAEAKSLGKGNPVIYAGGNVNLKISNTMKTAVTSYSLDIADEVAGVKVRELFGNKGVFAPKTEHESYVADLTSKLGVDITLTTPEASYSKFKTSIEKPVIGATDESNFTMEFKDGAFTDSSKKAVVDDIKATYKVTDAEALAIFVQSDFEGQVSKALYTSKTVGNKSSKLWYDEETTTLVIKKFVSTITMGDIMLNDKLDIKSGPSQDAKSKELFKSGSKAKWYISLALSDKVKLANGTDLDLGTYGTLWNKQYISNADFVISDATTSDMRR